MSKYTVKFYKGDYGERQRAANADNCIVYVEQHFNSTTNPDADYSCVIVGSNAGRVSREFGQMYVANIRTQFGCKAGGANGLLVGGYNGRGDGNIKHTNMPAVLLEPLFISNPKRAQEVQEQFNQNYLAFCVSHCIQHFFPNGGLVGFSVGHKYKRSNPKDRGAKVYGSDLMEADLAEIVLKKAEELLTQ